MSVSVAGLLHLELGIVISGVAEGKGAPLLGGAEWILTEKWTNYFRCYVV